MAKQDYTLPEAMRISKAADGCSFMRAGGSFRYLYGWMYKFSAEDILATDWHLLGTEDERKFREWEANKLRL